MKGIPQTALWLSIAGLVPFVWGALTRISSDFQVMSLQLGGARFVAPQVNLFYGMIILAFMSGVLWGFAAKANGKMAARGYALSVIPALWIFLTGGGLSADTAVDLILGFLGVLLIDWHFWRNGLTPPWWMALRVPMTGAVVLCLGVEVFH
ncbi:DUF3429 domain-containing protein [Tropicimonas sp. TH_r6]|uniref:DUF3429 domain-containing protein n=1 Tax=Tropicimonas sp. TH_r6 TaxID=3082085 RepID=UPI002955C69B|nr:DUF3429 domain-containing protein [Tropicimonas sp. TH_r6]MDV7143770.1 DUF3429 domain-containing protein [Tropicimonas sp. TH_r6]